MSEHGTEEGVIKFDLAFDHQPLVDIDISQLRAWRNILKQLGLLGQDPDRYGGFGFGNISARSAGGFVISGSQTGNLPDCGLEGYAEVTAWSLPDNRIVARGAVKPSSESLTHAAVYDVSPEARFVYHVHSPAIWRRASHLGIPVTDAGVAYGTPAMAQQVGRLACP